MNKGNAQARYSLILMLFWSIYGLMFGFATVYFRECGFSNTVVGLLLGGIYLSSALLQPAVARLIERSGISVAKGVIRAYLAAIAVGAVSLALYSFPIARCACVIVMFILQSSLQPEMVLLSKQFELAGTSVNYGAARGLGSLAYAGMMAILGYVFERTSPLLLPAFAVAVMSVMVLYIRKINLPDIPLPRREPQALTPGARFATRSVRFRLFLIGSAALTLNAAIQEKYLLQIVAGMGGGVATVGVISSVQSAVELPTMFLFSRWNRKISSGALLVVSGWAWFVKNGLILFANNTDQICLIQLLQGLSYALFIPAAVQFVSDMLPAGENVRGQSLASSYTTAGSCIAIFAGGFLIDALGVFGTLCLAQCFSLIGAVCLCVCARLKSRPFA